jgi:hypothetical protein
MRKTLLSFKICDVKDSSIFQIFVDVVGKGTSPFPDDIYFDETLGGEQEDGLSPCFDSQ